MATKVTARKKNAHGKWVNLDQRVDGGRVEEGATDGGKATGQDRIDQLIDQLITEGRMSREQATEAVDEVINGELGSLRKDKRTADVRQDAAVDRLESFLGSDEMAAIDPAEYVGDYESQAAGAQADERSRDAQYDALGKLKDQTGTQLTPEERFMMEQARVAQERDMRGAREAALRDMASRGVRSGSAEMAALLGGAQQTSNTRLMGDLGAQANAQKRSLLATEAYGKLGSDISKQTFDEGFKTGSAADMAAEFNKQLRSDYDTEKQRFALEQQGERFGRKKDVTDARRDQANDGFVRSDAVAGRAFQGSGQKVTALTGGNQTMEALKIALGQEEADRAAKLLKGQQSKPNILGSILGF